MSVTAPCPSVDPEAQGPPQVGLVLPSWDGALEGATPRWADVMAMGRRAEELGVASLWFVDHLIYRRAEALPAVNAWDCWTLLTALAAVTTRVNLGTLVSCTGFRNPVVTAKMAETLDEVSGGRLILGLGAGDAEAEHRALGVPYAGRVGRFEESLGIIRTLFTGGTVTHNGVHYRVDGAVLTTRGPRLTGPPLLIGSLGTGPRMLRLVAQYGDLWNGFLAYGDSRPEALATPLAALDAACVLVGRDPGTPIRTATVAVGVLGQRPALGVGIVGTPREIADALRAFGQMGITHLQVMLTPNTLAGIDAFACVLDVLEHG
jgi:alkanesulfonate monooxygenase SsuD/methylene tetrahydromethanopterin reductase-like flavin-dependent oxidoreductase (luciferase family)